MRGFKESFLYILKISNERFVDIIRLILFIKRIIGRKIDISDNKRVIILLLNILNDFIGFELDIKSGRVLRGIRIWMKFSKLLIWKLTIFLIIIIYFL